MANGETKVEVTQALRIKYNNYVKKEFAAGREPIPFEKWLAIHAK